MLMCRDSHVASKTGPRDLSTHHRVVQERSCHVDLLKRQPHIDPRDEGESESVDQWGLEYDSTINGRGRYGCVEIGFLRLMSTSTGWWRWWPCRFVGGCFCRDERTFWHTGRGWMNVRLPRRLCKAFPSRLMYKTGTVHWLPCSFHVFQSVAIARNRNSCKAWVHILLAWSEYLSNRILLRGRNKV